MQKLHIKSFHELNLDELYELLTLRQQVFVVEQECVYQDLDGLDQQAIHFLMVEQSSGQLIAYARLLGKKLVYQDHLSIGRVVVDPAFRKQGLGKRIMSEVLNYCFNDLGMKDIKISAQSYLKSFYEDLGFCDTGNHYLEDGIPHMSMIFQAT